MKKLLIASIGAALLAAGCCNVPRIMTSAPDYNATDWGVSEQGEKAHLWTVRGVDGLEVVFSDYGARIVQCWAPCKLGFKADVVMGWNTLKEYEVNGFFAGATIGRYANRIRDGKFTIDGVEYQLPLCETSPAPRHCNLHGGPVGWDKKVWAAMPFSEGDSRGIVFTLLSPDGDMGFPGTVTAKVTYTVLPGNVMRIEYDAETDKPTVISMTNHGFWNVAGESSGSTLGLEMMFNADKYTQTDDGLIPTVDVPVKGTGFDFTSLRPIGAEADWMAAQASLKCTDNWYDHNFVLNGKSGEMKLAAKLHDPKSGRTLEISTTEPCLQYYGAQNITEKMLAKKPGKTLGEFAAVALEPQHYPDSPNRADYPTTLLRPGEKYHSVSEYKFIAE